MKTPEEQFHLYLRGATWWAKVGTIDGRSFRMSCHTADRGTAAEVARGARAKVLSHRRDAGALRLAGIVDNGESWAEFMASDAGAELVARLHRNASQRARTRGAFLTIDQSMVRDLLLLSRGRCAVSGLELVRTAPRRHPRQASLDRIDNAVGYEASNLRVVALGVNLAMNVWGEQEFMALALGTAGVWMARQPEARFGRHQESDDSGYNAASA